MKCIETLEELIDTLKTCNPEDYVKVCKGMNIPKSEFEKYAHWKNEGYARNCIERNDIFELILICWNPGDVTHIHGHANQRCWVYLVEGGITELRFQEKEECVLTESHRMELIPGDLSFMEDRMGYHSLENGSEHKTMTLHLYISPIDSCEVFDDTADEFIMKELNYDSYKGVVQKVFSS